MTACGGQLNALRNDPAALRRYFDECYRDGKQFTAGCGWDLYRAAEKWLALEETHGKWTPAAWAECDRKPAAERCRAALAVFDDEVTAISAGAAWRRCRNDRGLEACREFPAIVDALRVACRGRPDGFACQSRFAQDLVDWRELEGRELRPGIEVADAPSGCTPVTVTSEAPAALPPAPRFLFRGLASSVPGLAAQALAAYFEAHLRLPPGAALATYADVDALVTLELKRDLLGCNDTTCMAEIAGALGADFVVAGEVGAMGATRLVSVRVVDTRTGAAHKTLVEFGADDCAQAAIRRAAQIALVAP